MLVTDIDGTLVDREGKVPSATLRSLERLHERGAVVVLATARHLGEFDGIMEAVFRRGGGYVITSNGMYLYDSQKQLVKTFSYLTSADLFHIGTWLPDAEIVAVTQGTDYCLRGKHRIRESIVNAIVNIKNGSGQRRVRADYDLLVQDESTRIEKLVLIGSHSELDPALENAYNVVSKTQERIELQHLGTDKAYAVEYLMGLLCIERADVVAVGDSQNDVQLLSRFPSSYAMDGGDPGALAAAHHVVSDAGGLGVSRAIRLAFRGSDGI